MEHSNGNWGNSEKHEEITIKSIFYESGKPIKNLWIHYIYDWSK